MSDTSTAASLRQTHPGIAAQIHPDSPLQAEDITADSRSPVLWRCHRGHSWSAPAAHRTDPVSRTRGRVCPYCSRHDGRWPRIPEGCVSLVATHPEIAALISSESPY